AGINREQIRTLLNSAYGITSGQLTTPDTRGLEYSQAGLRYTATVGPADLGFQYFFGNLFTPSWNFEGIYPFIDGTLADLAPIVAGGGLTPAGIANFIENLNMPDPVMDYSRYHQIGLDYAQVLFGFNLRAEFAAHITGDLAGDDGAVRNPFLAWSFGFDRDLVWGINANIQCNGTIRLLDDRIGNNPVFDCEAGTDMTSTRITARLSRKFLKDNLECKVTNIWDIEDQGCYIIPGIVWTIKDISAELSAGVFAGREESALGSYWQNSFVKAGIKYSF
ncbi:MAG: hypothetical protein LBP27_05725, partial [Treponema sp.]|nr:hypothetical protein [Treponema sp.]